MLYAHQSNGDHDSLGELTETHNMFDAHQCNEDRGSHKEQTEPQQKHML